MSNSGDEAFVGLLWIITIIISIGSGVLAWNWIEPESFFGVLVFLFVWGILSKIGHLIGVGLVAMFAD